MGCHRASCRAGSTTSEAAECAGALRLLIWLDAPRLRSATEDQTSTEAELSTARAAGELARVDSLLDVARGQRLVVVLRVERVGALNAHFGRAAAQEIGSNASFVKMRIDL